MFVCDSSNNDNDRNDKNHGNENNDNDNNNNDNSDDKDNNKADRDESNFFITFIIARFIILIMNIIITSGWSFHVHSSQTGTRTHQTQE